MLVVLAVSPVTAPLEAGFGEELEAEVVVGNLVGGPLVFSSFWLSLL